MGELVQNAISNCICGTNPSTQYLDPCSQTMWKVADISDNASAKKEKIRTDLYLCGSPLTSKKLS